SSSSNCRNTTSTVWPARSRADRYSLILLHSFPLCAAAARPSHLAAAFFFHDHTSKDGILHAHCDSDGGSRHGPPQNVRFQSLRGAIPHRRPSGGPVVPR